MKFARFGRVKGPRARRAGVLAILPVLLLGTSGCSLDETMRLGLPDAASDRAAIVYDVWVGFWIGGALVAALVWGLILWASMHYRRRDDDEVPPQTRYNLPLEVLYTAAPFIVILVLFFHTVTSQNAVLAEESNPDHNVQVVGQRWSWAFNYIEEGVYDVGAPDDLPELWLPIDESVEFRLYSPDVNHSFWVPEFYFKRDVFAGIENYFQMTPTEEGVYKGRCAELCGMYHSRMVFEVYVVPRDEYEQHIADLRAAGQVGALVGGQDARTVAGLEGPDEAPIEGTQDSTEEGQ